MAGKWTNGRLNSWEEIRSAILFRSVPPSSTLCVIIEEIDGPTKFINLHSPVRLVELGRNETYRARAFTPLHCASLPVSAPRPAPRLRRARPAQCVDQGG